MGTRASLWQISRRAFLYMDHYSGKTSIEGEERKKKGESKDEDVVAGEKLKFWLLGKSVILILKLVEPLLREEKKKGSALKEGDMGGSEDFVERFR